MIDAAEHDESVLKNLSAVHCSSQYCSTYTDTSIIIPKGILTLYRRCVVKVDDGKKMICDSNFLP